MVTSSTGGYVDVTPLTQRARLFGLSVVASSRRTPATASATQRARLFGLSVVVLGAASFAVALGALIAPAIEARRATALGRMTERQLLDDHVVVLGYGDMTEPILQELDGTVDFVVVTPDKATAAELSDRG